jgi:hypothetical protein
MIIVSLKTITIKRKENCTMKALIPCLVGITCILSSTLVQASITTSDLTEQTADNVANSLIGEGVSISNVSYIGADRAAGTFSGGTGIIGFEKGVILSTGNIASVVGPNTSSGTTTVNETPGDSDLDILAGNPTYDAAILAFDFIPNGNKVYFQYVFSSEEYNEYVNSPFNDVFGFFINNGNTIINCAVVGGNQEPVSINTINNGNPYGTGGPNSDLYINNDLLSPDDLINTEMDGLTVVLTCEADVAENQTNHIKLAIADASDYILDSNVFIEQNSFTTKAPCRTRGCVEKGTRRR